MGCWFACLRFRAQRSPSTSVDTTPYKSRDRLVSRNQLAAVFAPEERDSLCEGDAVQGGVDGELQHEAKFLKACGALLDSPSEFKASPKTNIQDGKQDGLFHSSRYSLPDSSCKKLQWDEQPDEVPSSPATGTEECLADNANNSSQFEKQQTVKTYNNTVHLSTPVSLSVLPEIRAKSVRFEVVEDRHGIEADMATASKATPQDGTFTRSLSFKHSPYPTPLKLTDEMETPGTVYPAKVEKYGLGNSTRIRSQYVYPVVNPILNQTREKAMSKAFHHFRRSDEPSEEHDQEANSPDGEPKLQTFLNSVAVVPALPQSEKSFCPDTHVNREAASTDHVRLSFGSKSTMDYLNDGAFCDTEQAKMSSESTAQVGSSLSEWLKPRNQSEKRINSDASASAAGKSPETERDRPIIGMVAAHWNSEESTRTSPKLWDGNGIPNSTNKYKEDQRVSWHATPFEERLEKALSDETLYPQRKFLNGLVSELDEEAEEGDTATS